MITDDQVAAIEALGAKYPGHPMAKFCVDPRRWDREAEAIAREIDVSGKVLDVGCGFGYFLNVCSQAGVAAVGLDVMEPIIADATGILESDFFTYDVRRLSVMPIKHILGYDIITLFGVNLRDDDNLYFDCDGYVGLTREICHRVADGGRFILRPNLPYTWDVDQWSEHIADFATVERTETTITVRPK